MTFGLFVRFISRLRRDRAPEAEDGHLLGDGQHLPGLAVAGLLQGLEQRGRFLDFGVEPFTLRLVCPVRRAELRGKLGFGLGL